MRFSLGQIVSVYVDNIAAYRLSRVQGQGQILVLRVQRQVLLVDRPLVDRVGTRMIDDFTAKNNRNKPIDFMFH